MRSNPEIPTNGKHNWNLRQCVVRDMESDSDESHKSQELV